MALNSEQSEKIRRWTAAKVKKCPVCGHSKTSHADELFDLSLAVSGCDRTGTKAVLIKCDNCAFVMPFAAADVGVCEIAVNRPRLNGQQVGLDAAFLPEEAVPY